MAKVAKRMSLLKSSLNHWVMAEKLETREQAKMVITEYIEVI